MDINLISVVPVDTISDKYGISKDTIYCNGCSSLPFVISDLFEKGFKEVRVHSLGVVKCAD